jgi:monovalent cation:H+ antiporter-2, CPA2 family
VLLMAVIGPVAARLVEPAARWVRTRRPATAPAPSAGN